jgi:hypothetical protein
MIPENKAGHLNQHCQSGIITGKLKISFHFDLSFYFDLVLAIQFTCVK